MDIELFEGLQDELTELGEEYKSLLDLLGECGDFNIFAEFDDRLCSLIERIYMLPPSDEQFELLNGVTALTNGYNSLIHSAC